MVLGKIDKQKVESLTVINTASSLVRNGWKMALSHSAYPVLPTGRRPVIFSAVVEYTIPPNVLSPRASATNWSRPIERYLMSRRCLSRKSGREIPML